MPSREGVQIRVGLFVFSGVFLAMVIIFLLGGEKQLFKRQYTLVTSFKDISGLRPGAQVLLAGVRVGMVDRINFSEALGDKRVEVRMAVNKEYQDRIRRDSIAAINTQGLLGDKIVALSLGSEGQEILKDGETIQSEERPSLFTIAEKGGAIMENINNAAKAVTHILEEVEKGEGLLHTLVYETEERPVARDFSQMAKELRVASRELREVLQKINRGEGTVGALVADPSLYNDLRRLFGKLERNRLLRHIIRSRIRDLELEKIDSESPSRVKD